MLLELFGLTAIGMGKVDLLAIVHCHILAGRAVVKAIHVLSYYRLY